MSPFPTPSLLQIHANYMRVLSFASCSFATNAKIAIPNRKNCSFETIYRAVLSYNRLSLPPQFYCLHYRFIACIVFTCVVFNVHKHVCMHMLYSNPSCSRLLCRLWGSGMQGLGSWVSSLRLSPWRPR